MPDKVTTIPFTTGSLDLSLELLTDLLEKLLGDITPEQAYEKLNRYRNNIEGLIHESSDSCSR